MSATLKTTTDFSVISRDDAFHTNLCTFACISTAWW